MNGHFGDRIMYLCDPRSSSASGQMFDHIGSLGSYRYPGSIAQAQGFQTR